MECQPHSYFLNKNDKIAEEHLGAFSSQKMKVVTICLEGKKYLLALESLS